MNAAYLELLRIYKQRPKELESQTLGKWFATCFNIKDSLLRTIQTSIGAITYITIFFPLKGDELSILHQYNLSKGNWQMDEDKNDDGRDYAS